MQTAALAVLAAAAAYLVVFGAMAIIRPAHAERFLGFFGQTATANWAEAAIRAAVGAAMVIRAPLLPTALLWAVAGYFLIAISLWMLLLPNSHRLVAARSVASVAPHLRLLGLASVAMGGALAYLISA